MKINLNYLSIEINRIFNSGPFHKVALLVGENGLLCFKHDVMQYFTSYTGLQNVLKANAVDLNDQAMIYQVLSKHILNQLRKPFHALKFPEIKSAGNEKLQVVNR
ncbi:MAG: hypothetical protein AB7V36_09615 [Bacteroidales bacterium]